MITNVPDTLIYPLKDSVTSGQESNEYVNHQYVGTSIQVIGAVACEFHASNDGTNFAKVADLAGNSITSFSGYYPYIRIKRAANTTLVTVSVARQLPVSY